jgi:hypothetical protein
VHRLEHRRVLVNGQPFEVSEPGQRLIDAAVTAFRLPWRGMLRRAMLRRSALRPGGTVAVALHQAVLLSSGHVLGRAPVLRGTLPSETDRTGHPARRRHDRIRYWAARELQNGHCLGS